MSGKTIGEQIADLKATRDDVRKRMEAVAQKSIDGGRAMTDDESAEFDTLESQIKSIDGDIERFTRLEAMAASTAKSVEHEAKADATRLVRSPSDVNMVQIKNTEKLEPGIAFARAAKCLALGSLEHRNAVDIAKSIYGSNESIVAATNRLLTKASVAAATTSNSSWAGALVGDESSVFADFVEFLRPQTIIGRFAQNGVPSLRRVPFRTRLISQTSGGAGYWVGEAKPKPLTKFDFSGTTLEPLKVANIAVASIESVRDSSPSADMIIRDQLAAALRERLDIDFIDPSKAASSGVSPASILNGSSNTAASSGNDADAVRADIRTLFGMFISANNAPTSGVWTMPATVALALSLMQNPLGQAEFPGIGMTGGSLFGLPVIVSEYVPTDSGGSVVALVNAGDIYFADDGGIDVSMTTEASLEMSDTPADPVAASTVLVSLFQHNMVGFRAERALNWARRRDSAVAYLTDVNWGSAGSP